MGLTHYTVLGLPHNADGPAIDRAFRAQLADCRAEEIQRRAAILDAFHTLSNPERRAAYDRQLMGAAPSPRPAPSAGNRTGPSDRPMLAATAGVVAGIAAAQASGWLLSVVEAVVISLLRWGDIETEFLKQFADTPLSAISSLGWNTAVYTKIDVALGILQAVLCYQLAVWVARKISKTVKERAVAIGMAIFGALFFLLVAFIASVEGGTDDHTLEMVEWLVFVASIGATYKGWWNGFRKITPGQTNHDR